MVVVAGIAVLISVIGGYAIFKSSGKNHDKEEIIREFILIKKFIFANFERDSKIEKKLSEIQEFKKLKIKYNFTIDGNSKFLILRIDDEKVAKEVLLEMSKASYYEKPDLYLSIYSEKVKRNKPIPEINIFPEEITTITHVSYSYSETSGEKHQIESVVWGGNKERFELPGKYEVTLKIKNKLDVWSDIITKSINVDEINGIKSINSSNDIIFILYNNGDVKYKAFNKNKLGLLVEEDFRKYIIVKNIAEISMKYDHILLKTNKLLVEAAGSSCYGQLGLSSKMDKSNFTQIWGIENASKIQTGYKFSGVLTKENNLFLWGINDFKQIKFKASMYYDMPQKFTDLKNISDFSLGKNHCLIKSVEDKLYSLGSNEFGQLGNGYSENSYELQDVIVLEIECFYAGDEFSFAVDKKGNLYGWGKNSRYQLGMQGSRVKTPTIINSIKNIIYITASENIIVCITKLGDIYTWGTYYNKIGEVIEVIEPTKLVGADSVKGITIANNEVYVLTIDGEIFVSDYRFKLKKIEIE
jgi:hypothetical protein